LRLVPVALAVVLLAACGQADPDVQLLAEAQADLKLSARDPESVRFGQVWVSRVSGVPAVCGTMNARNGFGGYAGERRFIWASQREIWVDEGATATELERRWPSMCRSEPTPLPAS